MIKWSPATRACAWFTLRFGTGDRGVLFGDLILMSLANCAGTLAFLTWGGALSIRFQAYLLALLAVTTGHIAMSANDLPCLPRHPCRALLVSTTTAFIALVLSFPPVAWFATSLAHHFKDISLENAALPLIHALWAAILAVPMFAAMVAIACVKPPLHFSTIRWRRGLLFRALHIGLFLVIFPSAPRWISSTMPFWYPSENPQIIAFYAMFGMIGLIIVIMLLEPDLDRWLQGEWAQRIGRLIQRWAGRFLVATALFALLACPTFIAWPASLPKDRSPEDLLTDTAIIISIAAGLSTALLMAFGLATPPLARRNGGFARTLPFNRRRIITRSVLRATAAGAASAALSGVGVWIADAVTGLSDPVWIWGCTCAAIAWILGTLVALVLPMGAWLPSKVMDIRDLLVIPLLAALPVALLVLTIPQVGRDGIWLICLEALLWVPLGWLVAQTIDARVEVPEPKPRTPPSERQGSLSWLRGEA